MNRVQNLVELIDYTLLIWAGYGRNGSEWVSELGREICCSDGPIEIIDIDSADQFWISIQFRMIMPIEMDQIYW